MSAALAAMRLDELLRLARSRGASDLHLSPGFVPMLRIGGALQPYELPTDTRTCAAIADHVLDERAGETLARRGEITLRYEVPDSGPFRIHAYRCLGGVSFAARVLGASIPLLHTLGLPAVVGSFARRRSGLVLFGGPTGSGKTTSLASVIARLLAEEPKHVIVIEDPNEYRYHADKGRLTVRELGRDTPDFATAVCGALRADPDVLVVGEMRDRSTMRAVLAAAETGHLVFSTVHTADSAQTVDRIVHSFAKDEHEAVRVQLAQTRSAVVCQRLIVRKNAAGQCAAAEVWTATDAIRSLVREGKTHQLRNAILTGRATGMQSLEEHLSERVMRGDISLEAARCATDRPNDVRASAVVAV